MAEIEKPQNNHYVPEWVLHKFRRPYLFELDIRSGKVEKRHPQTGASEVGLWSRELEDALSVHDNAAAQIFKKKIHQKEAIDLAPQEKTKVAHWLAQFYRRSPKRLVQVAQLMADNDFTVEGMVRRIHEDPDSAIGWIRDNNPEYYNTMCVHLGDNAHQIILERFIELIRLEGPSVFPTATTARHSFMRQATTPDWAKLLLTYHWTWLYSDTGFVIGDDPLVSWHPPTGQWDYGIALPDGEITFPISLNVSLLMRQYPSKYGNRLRRIRPMVARSLNCRQRMAAIENVYGNSEESLDFVNKPVRHIPID